MSETELETINSISNNVNTSTLIVFWQLILKVLDELSIVSSPILSLEMLIVRLVHLKGLPSYEDVLESLKKNNLSQTELNNTVINDHNNDRKKFLNETNETTKIPKDQIKNTTQAKPIVSSLNPKNLSKDIFVEKVPSFEELMD